MNPDRLPRILKGRKAESDGLGCLGGVKKRGVDA